MKALERDYIIDWENVVGVGCSSVVQVTEKASGTKFVAKVITLAENRESNMRLFYNEAQTLKELNGRDTPNIVKLATSGIIAEKAIIILEQLDGDLLDLIIENVLSYNEKIRIFKQLCIAVKQCHDNGIAHLDVKPDNVLVNNKPDLVVKLADFGGCSVMENGMVKDVRGTLHYNAPEIFAQTSDGVDGRKADIWSLGILLHVLITGTWPIQTNDPVELRKLLTKGQLQYASTLTKEEYKFISKFLSLEPKKRPTIEEVLAMEFVSPTPEHCEVPLRKRKNLFQRAKRSLGFSR